MPPQEKIKLITDSSGHATLPLHVHFEVGFNFFLYFWTCVALLSIYLILMLLTKKNLLENIKDIVVIIFETYGVIGCLGGLVENLKIGGGPLTGQIHATNDGFDIVAPALNAYVFICIGCLTVGIILAGQIYKIYKPLFLESIPVLLKIKLRAFSLFGQ